ncbi:MAG TPA: DUF6701 domain-containing protein [Telluria sp.]
MKLPLIRFVLMLMLASVWQGARADTEIRLLKSFAGKVNFVGTQKTIRNKGNNKPCEVFGPSADRTAMLSGIPADAVILSAHLYWAGSGSKADNTVSLDGKQVIAPADRQYSSGTIGNNFDYFAGAADVTEQVKIKRNAEYTFSGLTVDNGKPYCAVEGVLGGFSLLVIYSEEKETFRLLNLYEGFRFTRYNGITLNLSGFRVPNPLGTATGRIGHITWEGDASLDGSGENLTFNNVQMTGATNPAGNQFNSQSNINSDEKSFGIDFDAYTVGSPVIKPGDTTASTRYESGQDLVLLNAEIVALPNVPMADLSIEMTRNNEMALGQEVGYSITVTNNGPSVATNPTVVTNTLPAELKYLSAAGNGWTCTVAGQVVTCSHSASLASGAALPTLTITATVVAKGTIVNSAVASGKEFDPELANNTATAKGTVAAGSSYKFTQGECKSGIALGHLDQTCTDVLPTVTAGVSSTIHITAMADGVPTMLSADKATPVKMSFALSCHKPSKGAGVPAKYAGTVLKACAADGNDPAEWSPVQDINMPAGSPSVAATFVYDDVGRIQLFMRAEGATELGTALPFVSVPYEIRLTNAAFEDAPLDQSAAPFVPSGAPFDVTVGAYNFHGKLTPNFGAEGTAAFALPSVERGAPPGSPAEQAMTKLPELGGTLEGINGGAAAGKFKIDEVGVVKLTPALAPALYLGLPVKATPAYVGRFYPAYFLASAKQMDCLPRMLCSADVSTAAYSKQPLIATVTAYTAENKPAENYQGVFARPVTLSAHADPRLEGGNLSGLEVAAVPSTAFNKGVAEPRPEFALPKGFDRTALQGPWSAPTRIFLRASEAGGDGVTSFNKDSPHDVGIQIISGRLLVPNAHGSERLNLPLKVQAQYWTGFNWELSKNDSISEVDLAAAKFEKATGALATGVVTLVPQTVTTMAAGVAGLAVKVVPAAAGSVDLTIDGAKWLPSTKGRLKFGTYKSPHIYMREVH